jgi:hypothetical protein
MSQERRSAPRIRAYRPVRLYKVGNPYVIETLTKDLSVAGLRCISSSIFPVSTGVNIELVLSMGEEIFTARGRTKWFTMIPKSDQFDIGISFEGLPLSQKHRLGSYLDHIAAKPAEAEV